MATYRIVGNFRIDEIEANPDNQVLPPAGAPNSQYSFSFTTSEEVKQFINQKVNEAATAAGATAAVYNAVKTSVGA